VAEVRAHLKQQGACPGAPDDWTVAQWLAAPVDYPPVGLALSGLLSVEALLADRTMESFGPFGATSQRAALSIKASRLVSDLFTWVAQPQVAAWRELTAWPGRYRIDALLAETPNLAHILLGSGACLAWPERVRLQAAPQEAVQHVEGARAPIPDELEAARELDFRIRKRFDPDGRFV